MTTATKTIQDRLAELKAEGAELAKKSTADDGTVVISDETRKRLKEIKAEAGELEAKGRQAGADAELLKDIEGIATFGNIGADTPRIKADEDVKSPHRTLGQKFANSDVYQGWLESKGGRVPSQGHFESPAVTFGGFKDVLSASDDDNAGVLVRSDWLGLLDGMAQFMRPLTMRDLVTGGTTGTDTIEYARMESITNNAAPVAEAVGSSAGTGSGDVAGTKPESGFTLEPVVDTVKTIAHWIAATRNALNDVGQLATLIDAFLRYGLDEELEDQMVAGNGVGQNMTGILNTSGVQSQAWDTDLLVTARKARTKIAINGRARATGFMVNPADAERYDLMRDGNQNFYFGGPQAGGADRVWRVPMVESETIPEGTGLMGAFRWAILWDREQTTVQTTNSHADFFIRNLVAVLAELRAGFGVIRPAAFCTVDLTAGSGS